MESTNPLARYFRQPAIYIKLPSNGNFWPEGSLELTPNGELPVYPMTSADEVVYRTPDALFNGQATVEVIQSCVPNIKNAWDIPVVDLDTILVSIRIASFGSSMPIGTKCPSCEEENNFDLNLNSVIDGLTIPDYSETMSLGDLVLHFKPLTYTEVNQNSMLQFEQQKTISLIANSESPQEEKISTINNMMRKINDLTIHAIAESIEGIETPDGAVYDRNYIAEWLANADRKVFETVKDKIVSFREQTSLKPLSMTCPDCQHKYEQTFTLDMSNFFAPGS